MIRIFSLSSLAAAAFVLALPASASATAISGTLDLSGAFQPMKNGNATQSMAQSDGIDFLPLLGGTGSFAASNGTGDLTLFSGASGTIKDFTFAPFAAVLGFYTITSGGETLTFDLTGITIDAQSADSLDLSGTGTLHLTGFADTAATWDLEALSSNGASPHATFSWTALTDPPVPDPVPEPSILALLAAPVLGLGVLRRRRKAA
jgi:hypothetical protein